MNLQTQLIHVGSAPEETTGAVIPPIFTTTTYQQMDPGEHRGFVYSRAQNPTRSAFETCLAAIEHGSHAYAFSSGMAAIATFLELLSPEDHIVSVEDLYGGTFRLFESVRKRSMKLSVTYGDLNHLPQLLTPRTRCIWIETPTNPLLTLVDIQAVVQVAREREILVVVDNTFATPVFQKPLDLGADCVVHSTTKYLNGHSDVIGGCLVVRDSVLAEQISFLQKSIGSVPSPFDCYLAHRGLKTLGVRMERHQKNAQIVAEFLENHSAVKRVLYPGLSSHPQHSLARAQMSGYSGIISCYLKDDVASFSQSLRLFTLAESLGGVESLINHPATMTHASIPQERRESMGITNDLFRISVGIEEVSDLLQDLSDALG
jgi:cystathionine gamma-lyase